MLKFELGIIIRYNINYYTIQGGTLMNERNKLPRETEYKIWKIIVTQMNETLKKHNVSFGRTFIVDCTNQDLFKVFEYIMTNLTNAFEELEGNISKEIKKTVNANFKVQFKEEQHYTGNYKNEEELIYVFDIILLQDNIHYADIDDVVMIYRKFDIEKSTYYFSIKTSEKYGRRNNENE